MWQIIHGQNLDSFWSFCDSDHDEVMQPAELKSCAVKAAEKLDISESTQRRLNDLGLKYWGAVDFNKDGLLDYNEFTYTIAMLAVIDTKLFFEFDENGDNIIDKNETQTWIEFVQQRHRSKKPTFFNWRPEFRANQILNDN